ncbi:hypothetical protein HNQ77_000049 [Silvibacterium bohemicum]|uniref:TonB-dependent transporter Oar-like beta-barrel domain-containing protein n=1 Tax=Silvibacterium bohemicum TaxID=1577686 RepID=A0A841JT46_9BACT|nr:carboxypeptidase regulatory-like domain-containing protein [Silvibacterium bohemicum]MBB6142111.1 hypothetical protein [Silvibacterium bohemicum]
MTIRDLAVPAVIFALLLFCFCGVLNAQVDTGQVSGTISDPAGSVLTGVTVAARNLGTNAVRNVTASQNGFYEFADLASGKYELRVEAPGFAVFAQQFEVTVGGHFALNVKLSVASASEEVTVSAAGGIQVNAQTQELSQVVSSEQVTQLPSLTRNPYDFVAISGNVSNGDRAQGHDQNSTSRGVNFSLNGQRSTGTDILLDGVENIELFNDAVGQTVPIDSVQEYRVTTNNFAAQYGRASGGVVNVITKAGSNAFHGSAWEFNRLSAYTSNTYDNDANGIPKGTYTRNQFGFAVGGPIVKNKLFFFESTEWLRTRSSANSIALVPDQAFLAVASPSTRAFFAAYGQNQPTANAGIITQQQIVKGSGAAFGPMFSALAPTTPIFDRVSYSSPTDAGGGAPTNQFYLDGRVDYNFSDKTQTYVRYALQKLTNTNGFDSSSPYSQFDIGDDATNNSVLWNISHIFNPHLLTNTKLSYTRFNLNQTFDTALQGAPSLYLFPSATILGTPTIFPGFWSTNPDSLTNGLPFGGPENTIQWNQDVTYSRGAHELQFGTQVIYLQDNEAAGIFAQADEQLGTNQANSLENFLSGNVSRFAGAVYPQGKLPCAENYLTGGLAQTPQCTINLPATQPSFARSNRFHDWAAYAQDSWKARPGLTLNYGVRYEYYGVQHNNNQNLDSNFYFGAGPGIGEEVRNGQVLTAPNSPNHRLWNPSYGTVAPRVGFAYDITGDGKTSVRGGFGISYERNFGNITFNIIENPPNYAVVEITSGTPITVSSAGPLAANGGSVALPPTELRQVDPNIKTAQTQFWSLALERQIVPNTVLSLQYAGARGIHLYDIKDFNSQGAGNVLLGDPLRAPGEDPSDFHYSRLNNQYTSINTRGSNGDSYYDALNISLQSTNLAHTGLNITANYTYSHNIDDISSTFSESNSASNGVGNLGYLDPENPGLDRGNSDIDLRQRFVLAPIWNTPWFEGQRGWKAKSLSGYHVSGIYQVRSGTPFSVSDSSNSLNAGSGYGIPRYAPAAGTAQKLTKSAIGSNFNGTPNNFLLANLPAALSYGNPALGGISDFGPYPASMTGRNYFTGPGAWNLDLAVSKTIPITEKLSLEARAEGFNILNHSNLYEDGVQNDVAQSGYGVPIPIQAKKGGVSSSSAGDERRFGQFALKVNF